jgi:uncharacterized Zn finger protein
MNDTLSLTESQIRDWVDAGSFERGWGYFESGHILNPRRQGNTLKARCWGSMPTPYRLQVTLGPEGIVAGHCSCPVGAGGHCKHVVAMLFTWVDDPEAFLEMEDLETSLQRRSKEELVVIIERMINRCPDLETLIELPVPGHTREEVDPDLIRRQVIGVLSSHADLGWQSGYAIADDLMSLVEIGEEYVNHQAWNSAVAVLRTIIEETLERYYEVHDEEGEILGPVFESLELLGTCFAAVEDKAQREAMLETLLEAYRWDVEYAGVGIGQQASDIILTHIRPEEGERVAQWLRELLPEGDAWDQVYRRREIGSFLLALEEEQMDDEAFLTLCRETDQEGLLVDRLLSLGRVTEAVSTGRESSDYELLSLADIFAGHERGDLAEGLIRERLQTIEDTRLIVWLQKRAKERGDLEEALSLEERLFWQSPSLEGYQKVRALARLVERWSYLREVILERLADEEELPLLIEIYVDEDEIDLALETLQKMRESGRYGARYLLPEVAQAAEDSRPRAAIRLYMEMVERLIAGRGRSNYNTAAALLERVRELYHRLDEDETWHTLIAQLREENRRLRALQDELDKAGL